jgi:hypothetical protein
MKRPWTNVAPCPIGKDLIGTHPKRLYFYLSNQPRLPFPEHERTVSNHRIISPSLTSATDDDDEHGTRGRTELSPSPEVELTPPDLDGLDIRGASLSRASSFPNAHMGTEAPQTPGFGTGRTSPPLDLHEHEFTQTAESLQQRRRSEMEQRSRAQSVEVKVEVEVATPEEDAMMVDSDSEDESAVRRCREAADAVFGQSDPNFALRKAAVLASSPMMQAREMEPSTAFSARAVPFPLSLSFDDKMDASTAWMELKSPETVELDELECLFETY